MNNTATLPSSSSTALTIESGAYLITITHRKTRIRTEKQVGVYENNRFTGRYTIKDISIPMVQIVVTLLHVVSGDVVAFRMTTMGSRTSITRSTTLPRAMIVNKTAFGDDMVPTGGKPESTSLPKAIAAISRMTRKDPIQVRRFFNLTLIEAGVIQ